MRDEAGVHSPFTLLWHLPAMPIPSRLLLVALLLLPAVRADPLSDHDRARAAVLRGQFVPIETILADALKRQPGTVVELELDMEDHEYEVESLRADGRVVELEYDAGTGRLLESGFETP